MTNLVVVSGPSGVGKGTVIAEALAQRPDIWLSVSTTTRPMRGDEVDGVNYHFVTREQFEADIADNEFLEWAEYAGNLYGTQRRTVETKLVAGRTALLEIDLQGARQVRESFPDALLIMVTPPSLTDLAERLRGRGTDEDRAIMSRMQAARVELAASGEFDHVICNREVSESARELLQLM